MGHKVKERNKVLSYKPKNKLHYDCFSE